MSVNAPAQPESILMTADTIGGVWTYAMELAAALEPHGIHVLIAAMGGRPTADQCAQASALANVELFESEFRLEWMADPWDDVRRAGDWLLNLEARFSPDLIHVNNFAHGDLPWTAPVVMVGHSCVLSWWKAVRGVSAPAEWTYYAERVRKGLRAADLVIAPTRAMLSALDRHYGPLTQTHVIANGRTAGTFVPGDKLPFILAAGRVWDAAKNIAALESVAELVAWPISVAGDPGPDRNLGAAIRYLGRLAERDLAAFMSGAAIYALPARYEPFGLSVLEAGLSGCALVLGDIPSLRENWTDAALFVDPDDSKELLSALERLIEDTSLRQQLAAAARSRAAGFTPDRMVTNYLAAYRSLPVKTCA